MHRTTRSPSNSCVIPAFNEARNLGAIVPRFLATLRSLGERIRFMKGLYVRVVTEYFFSGIAVPGYATIVVGMMFFSGIQLLSIGVLAEYVRRIYEEVKQCPNYLVSQRTGAGLTAPGPVAVGGDGQSAQPEASLL